MPLSGRAGPEFVVALHACLLAGARRAGRSTAPGSRAATTGSDRVGGAEGDEVLVVHSSGTTGAPRPVELTRGNVETRSARPSRSG